jgi:deoxyribodipyrimidine photolyase
MAKKKKLFDDPITSGDSVAIESIAEKLIKAADRIYDYHMGIAFGYEPPENFEKGNKEYQQKILDLVTPMITEYQQTKNISAKSANQVVALLAKGKISPKDAITLLGVVKAKLSVEELELELQYKKDLIKAVEKEENKDDEDKQ